MRGFWRIFAAVAALATACNALLGIDEAGPIRGQAGDASVSGNAGIGGGSGAGTGGTSGGSAGSGGAATCDASVVDDPVNCGACGHSCNGDACSQGKCVASQVTEIPFRLYYLTLTPDQIFASAYLESGIVRVSKANHGDVEQWSPVTLGYEGFSPVVVYGPDVYFAHNEGFGIYRASATSLASAQKIVSPSNNPGDVLVDATGIYWDTCGAGLWHAPISGSPESQLSASPDCAYRLALDGDNLWATSASTGSLFRVTKTTGAPQEFPVAPVATKTYALAVGQTHVYFATYDEIAPTSEYVSRLYRIDRTAPASPESLQGGNVFASIADMTIADGFLYFVSSGSDAKTYMDGRVMRVPLADPDATPEVVADNRKYPVAVAVDDQFVYWIDELDPAWGPAQIWRVAK